MRQRIGASGFRRARVIRERGGAQPAAPERDDRHAGDDQDAPQRRLPADGLVQENDGHDERGQAEQANDQGVTAGEPEERERQSVAGLGQRVPGQGAQEELPHRVEAHAPEIVLPSQDEERRPDEGGREDQAESGDGEEVDPREPGRDERGRAGPHDRVRENRDGAHRLVALCAVVGVPHARLKHAAARRRCNFGCVRNMLPGWTRLDRRQRHALDLVVTL